MLLANMPKILMEEELGPDGKPVAKDTPIEDKGPGEEVRLLTQAVGMLTQNMEKMQQDNAALTEALKGLKPDPVAKPEPKGLFDGIENPDELDAKQLSDLILAKVGTLLEEKIAASMGTVDEKVQRLGESFFQKNTSEALQKAAEKNADFLEWAPEIKVMLRDNPTLTFDRAYVIARSENPKKVAEMTKKYPAKTEGQKPNVFGLTPTSSRSTGTGKMSAKEAAEKAFDEVFAGLNFTNDDVKLM